jgi:hypothetical protein
MFISMTALNISFDEKAFIEFMINKFYHDESDEPCEILYDNYYKLYFPTDEIREAIRSKYYSGGDNGYLSLYHILLHKVQDVLLEDDNDNDNENDNDEMDAYALEALA